MALFEAAFLLRKIFHTGKAKNYNVSGCAAAAEENRLITWGVQRPNAAAGTHTLSSV